MSVGARIAPRGARLCRARRAPRPAGRRGRAEDAHTPRRCAHDGGYAVEAAEDGRDGLIALRGRTFDAAAVDVALPEMSGIEVCRHARREGITTPIELITARDALEDRILGLDSGADDYLVKSFALEELAARLRALLRRSVAFGGRIEVEDLVVDPPAVRATVRARVVPLSMKEFGLLRVLAAHVGDVVDRRRLLSEVWGDPGEAEIRISPGRNLTTATEHPASERAVVSGGARRAFAILTAIATLLVVVQLFTSSEFIQAKGNAEETWTDIHGVTAYGLLVPALLAAIVAVVALRRSAPVLTAISVVLVVASVGQWRTGHLISTLHQDGVDPIPRVLLIRRTRAGDLGLDPIRDAPSLMGCSVADPSGIRVGFATEHPVSGYVGQWAERHRQGNNALCAAAT